MPKAKKRVSKKSEAAKSLAFNRKAQWKAYKQLQMRADKAWKKFRTNVKKNARSNILIRDHNNLLLLLGECNYMARECARMAAAGKKR